MRGEKKKRHLKDSTIGIEWELGKKYQKNFTLPEK